jgi:Fic family protein
VEGEARMNLESFRRSPSGRVVPAVGGYWAFAPNPLPPKLTWTPALLESLSEADRALGELAGLGQALPNPYLLIVPFMRREAVLSSRIEGTQASLSDLYAYEAVQLELFESPSDVREVQNYVAAAEFGLEQIRERPFSLNLIRDIHARLMAGVRGERQRPGEFRQSQNWIGSPGATLDEATFVPPPVPDMRDGLDALEKYLHSPSQLPPLARLGLIHYQFEALHPFLDGNGRVGRLLITLLLCDWGLLPQPLLYLSAYFDQHRNGYYERLLSVSQTGAWEEWLVFFLAAVATQARDAVARARRLHVLRDHYRERFQTARAAGRLLQVVDLLFARPVISVRQVEAELGVSFNVARRYVDRLLEAGLVREITGRSRNRLFRADEVMRAIEERLEPRRGEDEAQERT